MTDAQQKLIDELYTQLYDQLYSYAYAYVKSKPLAEEAVHETFRIACEKPAELWQSPNPQGWIVIALKNTLRNMGREQKRTQELLFQHIELQKERLHSSQEILDINHLYADISGTEEYRILKERVIDGRSYLELAAARGITVANCRKRLERAKKYLQKILGDMSQN